LAVAAIVPGPIAPPPPARLSTTIGCPRCLEAASPSVRISTSVVPPAGNGTTSVIGLIG